MARYKSSTYTAPAPNYGVNITWNPDIEAYETSFPYNENFINWIKTNIPVSKRSLDYDATRKPKYKWLFEQATLETVVLPMMRLIFTNSVFKIVDKAKVEEYNKGFQPPKKPIDSNALRMEFAALVKEAGISTELTERKQYLKAAMYYHPDRNPENAAKMSRLNEIWSTVFVAKQQEQEQELV